MQPLNRRDFLAAGAIGISGLMAADVLGQQVPGQQQRPGGQAAQTPPAQRPKQLKDVIPGAVDQSGHYVLPPLKYPYDSLSEVIDEETMRLHHDKHHLGYVRGLIAAEEKLKEAREEGNYDLISHWTHQAAFNGAGHFLHCVFWDCIGPQVDGKPEGRLASYIERGFGSLDKMLGIFGGASKSVQGSGWGIIGYSIAADKLVVLQAQNHQLNSQWGIVPILCNDVWEHAYYLKYQNNRGSYVDAFPKIINWQRISERFETLAG